MTDTPAPDSPAQRWLLTAIGGIGVAVLAGAAFVASYDDLRALARAGGAARDRAFLYPGMVDGLIVVVVIAIVMARRSPWWYRAVRWTLLLILAAGAAAAGVQRAVDGYARLSHTWVSGGVAAAPWVILLAAVWLWFSMIKRAVRTRRGGTRRPVSGTAAPGTAHDERAEMIPGFAGGDASVPSGEAPGDVSGDADTTPMPARASGRASAPGLRPAPEPLFPRRASESRPDAAPARDDETASGAETVHDATPEGAADPSEDAADTAAPSDDDSATDHGDASGEVVPGDDHGTSADERRTLREELARQAELAWSTEHPAAADGPAGVTGEGGGGEPDRVPSATPPNPAVRPDSRPRVGEPVDETPDPVEEEPAPRLVARTSLPTDVRLVGPPQDDRLNDTQPDGISVPNTDPDGISIPGAAGKKEQGEEDDAGSPPPSSTFRSSPTPPRG